jgi:hypothetical protein
MTHFISKKIDFKGDDFISKLHDRSSELTLVTNSLGRQEVIITRA